VKFKTIEWLGDRVRIIDQRGLPLKENYLDLRTPEEVYDAIKNMAIRGAPAIGVIAGYGVALAALRDGSKEQILNKIELLSKSRPTAYNLLYALERMKKIVESGAETDKIIREAIKIHNEDIEICNKMGEYGSKLLPEKAICMTICNAGALATGGIGTALGVFYKAKEMGKVIKVFVPETRPFLQGARLTAWELMKNGIEAVLIADGAKAFILQREKVDAIFVGADRIALNGDTANKIGTFGLAINAEKIGVPFYVVAPSTTFDRTIKTGEDIPIEERNPDEITHLNEIRIAPEGIKVKNPVFDVTPHSLINGIITEKGILLSPFIESIKKVL